MEDGIPKSPELVHHIMGEQGVDTRIFVSTLQVPFDDHVLQCVEYEHLEHPRLQCGLTYRAHAAPRSSPGGRAGRSCEVRTSCCSRGPPRSPICQSSRATRRSLIAASMLRCAGVGVLVPLLTSMNVTFSTLRETVRPSKQTKSTGFKIGRRSFGS